MKTTKDKTRQWCLKMLTAFSICVLLMIASTGSAQQFFSLKLKASGTLEQKLLDDVIKKNAINLVKVDSLSAKKIISVCLNKFYEQGYLTASIDSLVTKDSVITAHFYSGTVYKWAQLNFDTVNDHITRQASLNNYAKKTFSPSQIASLHENILRYCENNGYPFASSQLKNVKVEDNIISATVSVQTNKLIKIDSIVVTGTAKISKTILYNYLYISPGDLYNESLIRRIPVRVKEISFINEVKPMQVIFSHDGCYIKLFLNDKKSSQVDGILGVLPADNKGGKTTITGDLRLRLQNSFAHGELIDFHWQQPKSKTQDLNIHFIYPFLFQTPFGVDAALLIHKQDTTYIDIKGNFGVNYFVTGGNYVKFFVESQTSNLLSTKGLENSTVLPQYADIKKKTFGLGFKKEQLDYRYNPRKGYVAEATAGIGTRTIEKNKKLNQALYDSLDLKATQYKGEIDFNSYIQLSSRNVLNLGVLGGALISDNIFTNELFLIGGLRSLRGFDEQSIPASQFVIGKVEYRFILDQGSYLQAFINAAYYENRALSVLITDHPFGFGAGLSFETRVGVFSFNYALGKEFDNPIIIRAAKIHFGIINYF